MKHDFEFNFLSDYKNVNVTSKSTDLSDVVEDFASFLLACGYHSNTIGKVLYSVSNTYSANEICDTLFKDSLLGEE